MVVKSRFNRAANTGLFPIDGFDCNASKQELNSISYSVFGGIHVFRFNVTTASKIILIDLETKRERKGSNDKLSTTYIYFLVLYPVLCHY